MSARQCSCGRPILGREECRHGADGVHRVVMARPAGIMCSCDRKWRDVPEYNRHLRARIEDPS